MDQNEQHVSTEAQRMTLEAMSAQLVQKLDAMIAEQEYRAREFAALHHSTLPIPMQAPVSAPAAPAYTTPAQPVEYTPEPVVSPEAYEELPPLPQQHPHLNWETEITPPPPRRTPVKKNKQEEDNNIGAGIVIFVIICIIMVLRSCS